MRVEYSFSPAGQTAVQEGSYEAEAFADRGTPVPPTSRNKPRQPPAAREDRRPPDDTQETGSTW